MLRFQVHVKNVYPASRNAVRSGSPLPAAGGPIEGDNAGLWDDRDCLNTYWYLCERE